MPQTSFSSTSDAYTTRIGGEAYSKTIQSSRSSYGQSSSQQQQQHRTSGSEYEKRSSLSSTTTGRKRVCFLNDRLKDAFRVWIMICLSLQVYMMIYRFKLSTLLIMAVILCLENGSKL